jgi:hypothetical protein
LEAAIRTARISLLAPEACQQRHTSKCGGPDKEGPVSDGQGTAQTAESSHVDDVTHGMHNAARLQGTAVP